MEPRGKTLDIYCVPCGFTSLAGAGAGAAISEAVIGSHLIKGIYLEF